MVNHNSGGSGGGGRQDVATTDSGASSKLPQMSLRQALFTYLFPIYMAWFGGLFCDLL